MKFITSVVIAVTLMFTATLAHAGKFGDDLAYKYLDGICTDETVVYHGIMNNDIRNQVVICAAGGHVYFTMGTADGKGISFEQLESEVSFQRKDNGKFYVDTVAMVNPTTQKVYVVAAVKYKGENFFRKGSFNIVDYTGNHILLEVEVFRDTIIMAGNENLNKGMKL